MGRKGKQVPKKKEKKKKGKKEDKKKEPEREPDGDDEEENILKGTRCTPRGPRPSSRCRACPACRHLRCARMI
jgi:hypothetical protein